MATAAPPEATPMDAKRRRGAQVAVVAIILLTVVGVFLRRVGPHRGRPSAPPPALVPTADKLPPQLVDVGPRLVSNQTSTPLLVIGRDLKVGDILHLGPPANTDVTLSDSDGIRGWTRLPPIDLPPSQSEADIAVTLQGGAGQARLTVANDLHFPDPIGLAVAGGKVCAISTPTDELRCVSASSAGPAVTTPLGDGPTAIASDGNTFVVGYEYTPELWILPTGAGETKKLPGPRSVSGLAIDEKGHIAYVAEHLHNQLWAIDLDTGTAQWKADLDPGPGPVAVAGDVVAVGSRQVGEVQLVARDSGKLVATLSPSPGTPIYGGHTEKFSNRIDGGLCVRGLAYSKKLGLLFVASSGPNIGPNPERMEVAMNGGVTVIDPVKREVRYHLGFGSGVTESLALDDAAGLLYASDIATGLVRVLSAKALSRWPQTRPQALAAVLATVAIPPPADFPLIRPVGDLGVNGRSGPELHSGPKALALAGKSLFALNRLSGTLAKFALSGSKLGAPSQVPLFDALTQPQRRLGQILYYADVGRTSMSCDACHVDGHVGGLLFSKTKPIRLYRATSVRGARETPPYFTPISERTLATTASFVGSRNRYQNPEMSKPEIDALALFSSEVPTPPNPYVQANGAPPAELTLPDGAVGHPKPGAMLFFGKAACQTCHPGPLFTNDQIAATRGRLMDVGTPDRFPLRLEFQDHVENDFPAQSLNGIWDLFPLLTTGAAGLEAEDDKLAVATRFPLRAVVDHRGAAPHGKVSALTPSEENDLLAFLLTL